MSIESVMPSTSSSSLVPFSSCLQSFPASGSFQMSQFFASGGQNIGGSASASIVPMNIQYWYPLGLTGLISLQLKDAQESSPTPQFKNIILQLWCSAFYMIQLSHPYMTTGKTIALTRWTFVSKVVSLLLTVLTIRLYIIQNGSLKIQIDWSFIHLFASSVSMYQVPLMWYILHSVLHATLRVHFMQTQIGLSLVSF